MKCGYPHHKPNEKDVEDMGKCAAGHELRCGPFYHAVCPDCDRPMGRPCGVCQQPVYECSC